jgi:hypothetical protein
LKGGHVFALPYASCLSTFRAPGWGTPAILPPCRWRNTTSWKLVPFSHRSASKIFITRPDCIPSPVVTQDGDHQPLNGEKQAGLRSWSRPQLQGCSSSLLGRRARRAGALPPARRAVHLGRAWWAGTKHAKKSTAQARHDTKLFRAGPARHDAPGRVWAEAEAHGRARARPV